MLPQTLGIKDKSKALLDEYYPKIEALILGKLLAVKGDDVDAAMTSVFEHSYDALPFLVKMVVDKEKYMAFLNSKRPQLKMALNPVKKEKVSKTKAEPVATTPPKLAEKPSPATAKDKKPKKEVKEPKAVKEVKEAKEVKAAKEAKKVAKK